MVQPIILASGSSVRKELLRAACVDLRVVLPSIDEQTVKHEMLAQHQGPNEIAAALALAKARDVSRHYPDALVIGADQVLEFDAQLHSKPTDMDDARAQLRRLRGQGHRLISAVSVCHGGSEVWRHAGQVDLQMRVLSDAYIHDYVDRNWDSIRHAVGCYKLEEEGVRLFTSVQGDYFHVLGMPLLELLDYLTQQGVLAT